MTTSHREIPVRLFAAARDRAGAETVTIRVPPDATIADVRSALGDSVPALEPLLPHLLFAVGTTYATDDTNIHVADEIVAFPPVSGG